MNIRASDMAYMTLTATAVVGGYLFLRYSYHLADHLPFTQEIVLVLLGTIATMLITATLLNKQTAIELRKEQSIKFVELKSEIYLEFIGFIEGVIVRKTLRDEDRVRLEFFAHKLAIIATPEVLARFHAFLDVFNRSSNDDVLNQVESQDISMALAQLTIGIRRDLVGENDLLDPARPEEIVGFITRNAKDAWKDKDRSDV